MTIEEIQKRIAEIVAEASDPEMAHELEDALHVDVLRAIANGTLRGAKARTAAALALDTAQIGFPRWYA